MRNITKIVAIATVALSLGACQTNQVMGSLGALAGAGGGGYAAHKYIGQGKGKMAAAAGGAIGGALLGGLLGNTLGMPYTNSNRIDQNAGNIYQNGQRIDGLERRVDQNGNVVYVQPAVQNNGYNRNPYNCRVRSNYVVCND